ncbi:MAG: hypothetical protein JOZ92_02695 [Candidatus Dormibacteraeota bacterium]|nr:hypothetical protein [Candidatus Dormibacteraeota bacterium]
MNHDPDDPTARSAAQAPLSDADEQALRRAHAFVADRQFAARGRGSLRTGFELTAGLAIGAAVIAGIIVLSTRNAAAPHPAPAGGVSPTPAASATASPSTTSTPQPTTVTLPFATFPPSPSCGEVDVLPDVQGLGTQHVWVVANGNIISSHDGGATWHTEYSGGNPLGIDAIDDNDAWVVAPNGLLATTDGGTSWHLAGEPSQGALASVHFVNDTEGFGVVYSTCTVFSSSDGGQTWQLMSTVPYKVQSLCFPGGNDGWIAAGEIVYHSTDLGLTWKAVLDTATSEVPFPAVRLQCGYPHAVSVQAHDMGGAAGSQPNAAWVSHDGVTFTQVYAGGMWNSGNSVPAGPGSYPGPLSIVSPSVTAWVGFTPAGATPAYLTESQADNSLTAEQAVDCFGRPLGSAFVTQSTGWVVCAPFTTPDITVIRTDTGGVSWVEQDTIPG